MPSAHVTTFQTIAPVSAPKITLPSTTPALTMPVPTVCRDVQPEHRERDEIEERGPDDRRLRPQDARRHDGRDRVGRVVQTVQEIEQQRDRDQRDENGETQRGSIHVVVPGCGRTAGYACLAVMDWMALATSSHLSTTFSINSYSSLRSM